jgi:hypothetical protein
LLRSVEEIRIDDERDAAAGHSNNRAGERRGCGEASRARIGLLQIKNTQLRNII